MGERVKKPVYNKWWFWVFTVILVFILIPSGDDSADKTNQNGSPPVAITDQQIFSTIIEEEVGKDTNRDVPTIRSVEYTNGVLSASLNANDNLTNNFIKTGILSGSSDIMQAVFTQRSDVEGINLDWYMPFQDKYGNEADYPVVKITLTKETASKINWSNFLNSNLPTIADSYIVHPALNE